MATSSHETGWGEEPIEMNENPEASVFRSRIEAHRTFLEERIDPDFGLLDHLLSNKGITLRQYQDISVKKVPYRKCQKIIDSILQGKGPEKIARFCDALIETKQEHIVNYVNGDGEYKSQFGGNWPLGEAKVDILNDNISFLTENIDSAHGLLTCMIQKRAITQRQMEAISAHPEPCKKNEVLLDIIRRISQAQFEGTIEAFRASNQNLIADVLMQGGLVLSVHSKAESNLPTIGPAEEEIVQQIDEILQDKTPEESRVLFETYLSLKNSGLIAARHRKSIEFFFHCRNHEQLRRLLGLLVTEGLRKTIEVIYNRVLSTSDTVRVKVTWSDAEFDKAERKLEEIEEANPVFEKRVESTGMEDWSNLKEETQSLADSSMALDPQELEKRTASMFTQKFKPTSEDVMARYDSNIARDEMKQLLAVQELFKGRFDTEELAILLDRFEWNSTAVVDFVMTAEPAEVRQLFEDEKAAWVRVEKPLKKKGESLANKVHDLTKSGSLLTDIRLGRINTTARLFACAPCDHYWWRRTPERKEVSKCDRCNVRYDPVPKDKEWGWALFKCPSCQKEFGGFCGMWQTSPCFGCQKSVSPYCIQPPTKGRARRTTNTHRCNTPDCQCGLQKGANPTGGSRRHVQALSPLKDEFADGDLRNTDPGSEADYEVSKVGRTVLEEAGDDYYEPLPQTCVHPSSRRAQNLPTVIVASRPHDSSGSTVATFLTQGDLCESYETIIPMETIDESD